MHLKGSNSGVQLSLVTEILHLKTCDELGSVNFVKINIFGLSWLLVCQLSNLAPTGPT